MKLHTYVFVILCALNVGYVLGEQASSTPTISVHAQSSTDFAAYSQSRSKKLELMKNVGLSMALIATSGLTARVSWVLYRHSAEVVTATSACFIAALSGKTLFEGMNHLNQGIKEYKVAGHKSVLTCSSAKRI